MLYPNIAAERARRDMTIEDLAAHLKVTRKTIYNWQNTGHIPAEKLVQMADLFNCTVDYLLGREVKSAAPDA